jgi:hypothetical protein
MALVSGGFQPLLQQVVVAMDVSDQPDMAFDEVRFEGGQQGADKFSLPPVVV